MFTFSLRLFPILVAFATMRAAAAKYPITPNEVADVQNLGPGVNSAESEYTPFITPDEKFLFFQSNREGAAGPDGDFDIWYSMNKNAGKSGEPVFETSANVGLPINSESLDGHPTLRRLTSGEYEMYFASFASSTRPGPQLTNIYYTIWRGGKWTVPQPVAEINTDYHDRMPSISQDGRYLFFSSDRPGGRGGDDIWFSEWDAASGKWKAPQNAGSINTAASEVTPAIHADGTTLYFSSDRTGGVGGYDIYFTQSVARLENPEAAMLEKGWAEPLNLGKPFNSEFDDEYPTVTANGLRVYFTSNRIEGLGAFDVYRANLPDFARPIGRLTFSGKTLIAGSMRPIGAKVKIDSGILQLSKETYPADGAKFEFGILSQRTYTAEATSPGFKPARLQLETRGIPEGKGIERDFLLVRDMRLPAQLSLRLNFINENKETVELRPLVRLLTKHKKPRPFVRTNTLLLLDKGSDPDQAIVRLETMQVEIKVEQSGYHGFRKTISVSEILDNYSGELPAVIETSLVVSRTESKLTPPKESEIPQEKNIPQAEVAPRNYLKFLGRVYFKSDDAQEPLAGANAVIAKAAREWKKNPTRRLFVYGHTDSVAGRSYNIQLSKARAQWVSKKLIALGVAARKITVQGAGKSQLRVRNDNTETKRQKNRRVEIYIAEPLQKADGPAENEKNDSRDKEKEEGAKSDSSPAEFETAPTIEDGAMVE